MHISYIYEDSEGHYSYGLNIDAENVRYINKILLKELN